MMMMMKKKLFCLFALHWGLHFASSSCGQNRRRESPVIITPCNRDIPKTKLVLRFFRYHYLRRVAFAVTLVSFPFPEAGMTGLDWTRERHLAVHLGKPDFCILNFES